MSDFNGISIFLSRFDCKSKNKDEVNSIVNEYLISNGLEVSKKVEENYKTIQSDFSQFRRYIMDKFRKNKYAKV